MFSANNADLKSCSWGYGILMLIFLMGIMAGCSSRSSESDRVYSYKEEESLKSITEKNAKALSKEKVNQSSANANQSIPGAPYSPADREVVLRYAENGESDSANMDQALKLVQRAERVSSAGRMMEDYLILAAHYWSKGDMKQVVQYANQGITSKTDSPRVKALMFIYLGYTNESKSPAIARSYFQQAVQKYPGFYKGHYELGRILFRDKKFSEAQGPLEKAFNLNPEIPNIYGNLGQMFYGMDQYEKAAKSLEKALALSLQTN